MPKIVSAYGYSAKRGFEAKAYVYHSEVEAKVFWSHGFGPTPMEATLAAVHQVIDKCKANGTPIPTDIDHLGKVSLSRVHHRLF
jgi:endo-beta-N-acetylglucosaminidase D